MLGSLLVMPRRIQPGKSEAVVTTRVPPHRTHRFIKRIYYSVFWVYNWITGPHQPSHSYFLIRLVLHLLRPKSVLFQLHRLHRFACHRVSSHYNGFSFMV